MSNSIVFTCTPAAGTEIEDADQICAELLDAINQTRPDLRFIPGVSGAPAAMFAITRGNARGLGLEATWIDAHGVSTVGKPLSVTFFDRPSDPVTRSNFYAAFLRDNPIPF